jgi:molecular chaperone DnaK (HSP70)
VTYELGIDLGTTYTAAAVARSGRVDLVGLGNRAPVIPSIVLVRDHGTLLVGDAALRRSATEPDRVVREFKRRIGDPTPFLLGDQVLSAEALTAGLLRSVVDQVSDREGGPPGLIALTHPANWGPYKRERLAEAARVAGVDQPLLLSEPEAAALAYASTERVEVGSVVAVYDLGGGTFDAAVLRKSPTGFEIVGVPEGVERLGGIDFDAAVYAYVGGALGGALDQLDLENPAAVAALQRLRADCAEAKEALSVDGDADVPVLLPDLQTTVRITRREFEGLIRPLLAESVASLHRALRAADVDNDEVSAVLLVGGSSRIPLVAELVGAELGRPVAVDAHPKHLVAVGAALYAATVANRSRRAGGAKPPAELSGAGLPLVDPAPVDLSGAGQPGAAGGLPGITSATLGAPDTAGSGQPSVPPATVIGVRPEGPPPEFPRAPSSPHPPAAAQAPPTGFRVVELGDAAQPALAPDRTLVAPHHLRSAPAEPPAAPGAGGLPAPGPASPAVNEGRNLAVLIGGLVAIAVVAAIVLALIWN